MLRYYSCFLSPIPGDACASAVSYAQNHLTPVQHSSLGDVMKDMGLPWLAAASAFPLLLHVSSASVHSVLAQAVIQPRSNELRPCFLVAERSYA